MGKQLELPDTSRPDLTMGSWLKLKGWLQSVAEQDKQEAVEQEEQ